MRAHTSDDTKLAVKCRYNGGKYGKVTLKGLCREAGAPHLQLEHDYFAHAV